MIQFFRINALIAAIALLALCTAAPTSAKADNAATAAASKRHSSPLLLSELPAGTQRINGNEPGNLLVQSDSNGITGFDITTADKANLTVTIKRDVTTTMANIQSKFDKTIKLDLYISPDGEHYIYTSSCPILAGKGSFETWPHQVPWAAITAIRVLDESKGMVCN